MISLEYTEHLTTSALKDKISAMSFKRVDNYHEWTACGSPLERKSESSKRARV
jgi:hypothetical protein